MCYFSGDSANWQIDVWAYRCYKYTGLRTVVRKDVHVGASSFFAPRPSPGRAERYEPQSNAKPLSASSARLLRQAADALLPRHLHRQPG